MHGKHVKSLGIEVESVENLKYATLRRIHVDCALVLHQAGDGLGHQKELIDRVKLNNNLKANDNNFA
jgi:hypothetical protein